MEMFRCYKPGQRSVTERGHGAMMAPFHPNCRLPTLAHRAARGHRPVSPLSLQDLTHIRGPAAATVQGSPFSIPAPGPGGLGWRSRLVVSAPQCFLSPPPSELGCEPLESQHPLMALHFRRGPAGRGKSLQRHPGRP